MKQEFLDQSTKKDIDNEVRQILEDLNIIEPPFDLRNIVRAHRIDVDMFDDFNPYYSVFRSKINEADVEKIRGALLLNEKCMLIKQAKNVKRSNFTIAHELAHWRLEWHRELLFCCSEFDLRHDARRQLEREANYFANRIGFLDGKFNEQLAQIGLSLKGVKELAEKYPLSLEAGLISAVINEHRPCALMVLSPQRSDGHYAPRYALHSDSFKQRYADIRQKQVRDAMTSIVNEGIMCITDYYNFEMVYGDRKEKYRMNVEMWKNKYNAFAFILPSNQSASSIALYNGCDRIM